VFYFSFRTKSVYVGDECRVLRRIIGISSVPLQKFPDGVDNEINNNKHSLRSNTKGYGGKTH
jgi:hypothetical protein